MTDRLVFMSVCRLISPREDRRRRAVMPLTLNAKGGAATSLPLAEDAVRAEGTRPSGRLDSTRLIYATIARPETPLEHVLDNYAILERI